MAIKIIPKTSTAIPIKDVLATIFLSQQSICNDKYRKRICFVRNFGNYVLEVEVCRYKEYLFILRVVKNAQLFSM